MRIRTIKPEFFVHADLYELEIETALPVRVAFAGLWCASDRAGRFAWKPRALGVQILPYDCAAGLDFSRVLDACLTRGFVTKYRVGADWFGAIPSWRKHQFINNRETESTIPDISKAEEVAHASTTRAPRVPHATEVEGKGMDGNGMEGKEISTRGPRVAAPEALPFSSPEFAEAWANWGKHRTEIRKPLKPTMRRAQLRELSAMGEVRAIAAINHTIAKGWQGIREPDPQQHGQLPIGAQRVAGATKLSDFSPRPSLGALQIELKAVRDEIADILHPGGCTYAVEPKGEKMERYTAATARRDRINTQIQALT